MPPFTAASRRRWSGWGDRRAAAVVVARMKRSEIRGRQGCSTQPRIALRSIRATLALSAGKTMADEFIGHEGKTTFGIAPGRCIYCGSDGAPEGLSDEHIIAFSLGADTYLPSASCCKCAKVTSYIEGYAARAIYGPLRVFFGVQSRRKAIDLGTVPVTFTTSQGEETREISRAELPPLLALPLLRTAGIFEHKQPEPIREHEVWVWTSADIAEQMKRFQRAGDTKWRLQSLIKALSFCKTSSQDRAYVFNRLSGH